MVSPTKFTFIHLDLMDYRCRCKKGGKYASSSNDYMQYASPAKKPVPQSSKAKEAEVSIELRREDDQTESEEADEQDFENTVFISECISGVTDPASKPYSHFSARSLEACGGGEVQ